jgi:hypothetical protein
MIQDAQPSTPSYFHLSSIAQSGDGGCYIRYPWSSDVDKILADPDIVAFIINNSKVSNTSQIAPIDVWLSNGRPDFNVFVAETQYQDW